MPEWIWAGAFLVVGVSTIARSTYVEYVFAPHLSASPRPDASFPCLELDLRCDTRHCLRVGHVKHNDFGSRFQIFRKVSAQHFLHFCRGGWLASVWSRHYRLVPTKPEDEIDSEPVRTDVGSVPLELRSRCGPYLWIPVSLCLKRQVSSAIRDNQQVGTGLSSTLRFRLQRYVNTEMP